MENLNFIIIDERSICCDKTISVLIKLFLERMNLKVVIMSANMATNLLENYLKINNKKPSKISIYK